MVASPVNTAVAETGRAEIRAILRLAAPLVLAEIGWMMMGVVDTVMVGRVGANAIGAISIATSLFYNIGIFAGGLLFGLDTLVSRAFGSGDPEECRSWAIQGLWLALMLILPVMGVVEAIIPLLGRMGIDRGVLADAQPYMRAINWSAAPLLIFFALRRYLQGQHVVRPIMFSLVTANLVNIFGNWIFVFGNLGAPKLGAVGSGWSTCISRVYMMAVLAYAAWRHDPGLLKRPWRPDPKRIAALMDLGLPAAAQMGFEIAVFSTVTVLIGRLNATALAGHQIALATISTTFMAPLGISAAAAVRVGTAIGRGDPRSAARAGWTALAMGGGVMACSALALLLAPRLIAELFTPEAPIIAAGVTLLRIAAFFQLFDGLQVVATGALRGAGDTRTPMICHFTGYWVIGLPLGAVLAFPYKLGAPGLWMGLSTALILIGSVLVLVWRRTVRRLSVSQTAE
jgi:MATE family multidrug resistance protein